MWFALGYMYICFTVSLPFSLYLPPSQTHSLTLSGMDITFIFRQWVWPARSLVYIMWLRQAALGRERRRERGRERVGERKKERPDLHPIPKLDTALNVPFIQ